MDSGFTIDTDAGITIDPSTVVTSAPLSMNKPPLTAGNNSAPGPLFGGHTAPLPTNAFWENFVVGQGDFIAETYPYHVRAMVAGLGISKPETLTTSAKSCFEAADPQVMFGAVEAFTGHALTSWDLFSVTMGWQAAGGTMTAPVVHGMPYATALYDGLTPKITAPVGIRTVAGPVAGSPTGTRFVFTLNDGQIWILYASESVTVSVAGNIVTFAAPLKGWLRFARQDANISAAVLDMYSTAIPIGGQLRLSAQRDTGVVEFSWQTQGSGELLMMALPHHVEHLISPQTAAATFTTIRGKLQGIVGKLWQSQYPLSTAIRAAPRAVDPTHAAAVTAALNADVGYQPGGSSAYVFGKSIGKAAELLLIGEALGQTAAADQLRKTIESALSTWLDGAGPDPFVYDQTYGGIVTKNALGNSSQDFGNGIYNDHHFHYGYFLYAAGAVAKGDPAWATKYKESVLALVRDIANPSATDPYFTQFRMMDWYEGHSWASGLWPFVEGRNQESSSEAFNAWAGLTLFGDAIGDKNLSNLGRIMRAVEAASVKRYYHVRKNSDIYPAAYANLGVGILWSSKADFASFFTGNATQIYAIQMLPMTIACEELIEHDWIVDAWPTLQGLATPDGWGGLLYMSHAVIDKATGWTELTGAGVEPGNSRTNMLYWAATRP
jgi:endo-1,3(4)-beta-glucanase